MKNKSEEVAAVVNSQQEFTVGKIALPINPLADVPYKPLQASNIIGNIYELETIALGIKMDLPVLAIGDTGTGKTSFIRYLAYHTNNGFRRLNLNGGTTTDELIGHYVIDEKESGMRWVDGVLLDAMKNGYWLLLDELNAALPEVLFVLQSVLDDDRFLVVAEHEGEIVRPHGNFRVFATMNPSTEYAGTKDLNKALLSRFPIVVQTHYPANAHEIDIIKYHVPGISDKDVNVMVRIAEDIRKSKKQNTISFICSTRELINWGRLIDQVGLKEAALLSVLNKCELETDKKTVEDLFKLHFGKWQKDQVITLDEMEKQLSELQAQAEQFEMLIKDRDAEINSYKKVLKMNKPGTPQLP